MSPMNQPFRFGEAVAPVSWVPRSGHPPDTGDTAHEGIWRDAHILVADDEPQEVSLLERLLGRQGYRHCKGVCDSHQVLPLFLAFRPDLLILDLLMPDPDGWEILRQLAPLVGHDVGTPILVLSGDSTPAAKRESLALGAGDFLTKPFDDAELMLRVRNLLVTRRLHLQLRRENDALEQRVHDQTQQLAIAELGALQSLALAAEFRDDNTGAHSQRVGQVAAAVAAQLSLPDDQVRSIRYAAPLHDVGKLGVPDAILLKPGALTDEEAKVMQTHTTMGARILSVGDSPLLRCAREIALTHHERWDGTGYPTGLAGEGIPLSGRVVAVADVFDAMRQPRTYKTGWSMATTVDAISSLAGRQFDPEVVQALLRMVGQLPGGALAK